MKFLIASNNRKKRDEMQQILSALEIEVVTPQELGIQVEVEENGTTYEENAFLKAQAFLQASHLSTVADDSGMEVEALDGRPGLYSARYGGEGLSDRERTALLLEEMKDIKNRKARFISCIVCMFPDGDESLSVTGICEGEILYEFRGDHGFGYDPVFLVPEKNKTLAEMMPEEKNQISHRARALRLFSEQLKQKLHRGE